MSLVIVSVVCLSSGNVPPESSLLSILTTVHCHMILPQGWEKEKKKTGVIEKYQGQQSCRMRVKGRQSVTLKI